MRLLKSAATSTPTVAAIRQTNRRLRSSSRCSSSVRRSSAVSAIAAQAPAAASARRREPAVDAALRRLAGAAARLRPAPAGSSGGAGADVGERRLRRDRRRLAAARRRASPGGAGVGGGARRRVRRLRPPRPPAAAAGRVAATGASMADLRSTLDLRSLNVPVTSLMGSVSVDLTSLISSVDLVEAELRACAVSAALRNSRTPLAQRRAHLRQPLGPEDEQGEDEDDDDLGGADAHAGVTSVGGIVPFHRREPRGPKCNAAPATAADRRPTGACTAGRAAGNTCKSTMIGVYPHRCPFEFASRERRFGTVRRRLAAGSQGRSAGVITYRMTSAYLTDWLYVWLFIVAGAALVVAHPAVLQAHQPEPPHAGEAAALRVRHPAGRQPVAPFAVRYFVFGLLFLVFDVEAVFLFPWALVFRGLGTAGFVEMLLFIAVLGFGLLYAWRKGALEWA